MSYLRTALCSGIGAAAASLAAVAILSRLEGRSPLRPINATSHVIRGPEDDARDGVDPAHSLPGVAINVAAAGLWGTVFALGMGGRADRTTPDLIGRAGATALLAAVLDYGLLPRRLRPGWELALPARCVAMAIGAMGGGLAAGGLAARSHERRPIGQPRPAFERQRS